MTITQEALRLAEEALDKADSVYQASDIHPLTIQKNNEALAAIREATVKEYLKPVAFDWEMFAEDLTKLIKAYTDDLAAPPQKPWVNMTAAEINEIVYMYAGWEIARAVGAKLKEKNA